MGDPSPFGRYSASAQQRSRKDDQNTFAADRSASISPPITFNEAAAQNWRKLLIEKRKRIPRRG